MYKLDFISKILLLSLSLFHGVNVIHAAEEVDKDILNLDLVSPAMDDTTVPTLYNSQNDLSFGDPCQCGDPLNCEFRGVYYFHDSLKVTAGPNLVVMVEPPATDFFTDCAGTLLVKSMTMVETATGSGMYKFEYWRPSGAIPSVMVNVAGTVTAVPAATFQAACFRETCNPIPTLDQWGLMTLAVLFVIVGIVAVPQRSVKRIE